MRAFDKTIRSLLKWSALLIAAFLLLGFAGPPLLKEYAGALGVPPEPPKLPAKPLTARFDTTEEDITFQNEGATLSGTLILPHTPGPHPAVIVLGGSGWKYRWQIRFVAEKFAPRGIATLVFDKRSYGKSTGDPLYSFHTVARDAIAAVHKLQQHPEIDARQIGLYGVSRGGWHAPLAASLSKDVAFLLLFVAPSVSPEQQEAHRIEHTMRADGFSEADIRRAVELKLAAVAYSFGERDLESYRTLRRAAEKEEWFSYVVSGNAREKRRGIRKNHAAKWVRLNMRYDPVPAIETLQAPVLALFGELDRNVLPAVNVPLWEQALQRGGHRDYQLVVVPRANHGLRLATTGGRNEPRGPVSPQVWPTVFAWLAEHVSRKD